MGRRGGFREALAHSLEGNPTATLYCMVHTMTVPPKRGYSNVRSEETLSPLVMPGQKRKERDMKADTAQQCYHEDE